MPDNVDLASLTGLGACDLIPYSGDSAFIQLMRLVHVIGTEGSKTHVEIVKNTAPGAADYGLIVRPAPPLAATAAVTSVAANVSSVSVLAANTARLRAMLYNNSASSCYMKFGTGASSTSFTKRLLSNEYFEVPLYSGIIHAIWDTAVGSMLVTEVTA